LSIVLWKNFELQRTQLYADFLSCEGFRLLLLKAQEVSEISWSEII
jgi:hypothetical protein